MKNKLVANILIAYFLLLTVVLIIQFPKKNIPANEPIARELKSEEKLRNAVVFYEGSPLAVINETQAIIDPSNPSIVPETVDGIVYIPVSFFKSAYNAAVDVNEQSGEITIRYNNTAVILKKNSSIAKVISSDSDSKKDLGSKVITLHNSAYVPAQAIADVFGKEFFYNDKLIILSNIKDIFDPSSESDTLDLLASQVNTLPTVGNEEKLKSLIENISQTETNGDLITNTSDAVTSENTAKDEISHSDTNNQVDGVTEADIVKTDGSYIYYARGSAIEIVDAENPSQMNIAAEISFDNGFSPNEIYIKDKRLIVMGIYPEIDYPGYTLNGTPLTRSRISVYSLDDISNPYLLREIDVDGKYFDSRMIDDTLYFIATADAYSLYDGKNYSPVTYCDSAVGTERKTYGFDKMKYFPDMASAYYTTVIAFDTKTADSQADIKSYLGSGENIYVSENNLYFACGRATNSRLAETNIYKFALSDASASYKSRTSINGYVLNRFSMDESDGYFRVAASQYDKNYKLSSSLYVFDSNMIKCGEINNIAEGEKIYSARFMGSRAYLVTFQTVDPLFVIDLKDPENPEILGELKIPGYSDYLHPYDDNHLIGIGKDTVTDGETAIYTGLKLSLFDVTDVNSPKEMYTETIGDRGTESPALSDHKAFLFDKDKNILAFPVSLCLNSDSDDKTNYGELVFQGAYVYSLDLENGFVQKTRITHSSENEINDSSAVKRIIYIGNNIYVLSNNKITAHNTDNYEKTGEIIFKADEESEVSGEIISDDVILE